MIEESRRSDLVSYPIRDIVIEALELEKKGTEMVYLNIGDPAPFGFRPPQHILDAVKEAVDKNYSGYAPSPGDPELRAAAAEYEGVQADDVFIGAGLSECIDFLYQALIDPGRNLLLPTPTYPLYLSKQRVMFGTECFYDSDEKWIPDTDSLRKNINEFTRAILVINPNNPTGAVYPRKVLEEIVNIAGEHKLPIIADDAYEKLVFDGDYVNMRDIHKDVPLISGNSLSKNFVYPGARVGYVAFHGEGWDKIKDAVMRLCNARLSVNWEMQRGYIAALKGPMDHINKFNADLRERRDLLVKRIDEIEGLSVAKPNGSFYAFVRIEDKSRWKDDWQFTRELLREGCVVVPGSGFTSDPDTMAFRIVFLPSLNQINSAMDKLDAFMKRK
jgi:aspartate/methionine/tyrosine aminotransferase